MAGVPAASISAATGADAVVRAMPNAAVEIRQSFTPWYCAGNLVECDRQWVQRLFECVGSADEVPDEDCIDYLSALSGTGPAFPAMLQMALTNQAVAAGIPLPSHSALHKAWWWGRPDACQPRSAAND